MRRPEPRLAMALRISITSPISPLSVITIGHWSPAISQALRPALTDSSTMTASRFGCRVRWAYARARANIMHLPGEPGVALLDFDRGGMPQEVKDRLDALGGFESAIMSVVPELAQTARLLRPSTSAGIRNIKTGEVYGAGGYHLYVLLADATDSEWFLKLIQQRCWLAGLGWLTLSAAGSTLVKSIVDTSTWGSERLCYEASPILGKGLVKEPRVAQVHEGVALDTRLCIPDLSDADIETMQRLQIAEYEKLQPQIDIARGIHRAGLMQRALKRGVSPEEAKEMAEWAERRVLLPTYLLWFQTWGWVRVDDILADPEKFKGKRCADPEEGPDYMSQTPAIVRVDGGDIWIDLFAHGAGPTDRRFYLRSRDQLLELAQGNQWLNGISPEDMEAMMLAAKIEGRL